MKKKFKFNLKNTIGELVLGFLCCFVGIGLSAGITSLSGWYNKWFFTITFFIYSIVLILKFNKKFIKYWNKTDFSKWGFKRKDEK